jgi:hypothetical protein
MVTFADVLPVFSPNLVDVIALDAALDGLARVGERLSRVVELKFFAGPAIDETAPWPWTCRPPPSNATGPSPKPGSINDSRVDRISP